MLSIGKNIVLLRKTRGLNQQKLAENCGITNGHLSKIERELVTPKNETLEEICIQLGVSLGFNYIVSKEEFANHSIQAVRDRKKREEERNQKRIAKILRRSGSSGVK